MQDGWRRGRGPGRCGHLDPRPAADVQMGPLVGTAGGAAVRRRRRAGPADGPRDARPEETSVIAHRLGRTTPAGTAFDVGETALDDLPISAVRARVVVSEAEPHCSAGLCGRPSAGRATSSPRGSTSRAPSTCSRRSSTLWTACSRSAAAPCPAASGSGCPRPRARARPGGARARRAHERGRRPHRGTHRRTPGPGSPRTHDRARHREPAPPRPGRTPCCSSRAAW